MTGGGTLGLPDLHVVPQFMNGIATEADGEHSGAERQVCPLTALLSIDP